MGLKQYFGFISKRISAFLQRSQLFQHRWIGYLIARAIYVTLLLIPLPGFEPNAQRAFAVFGLAAFSWGTTLLPLPVTAIVILFLLPFSGAISAQETYAYFGNRAVFFILGAFILAL
ncbi:anion permease [Laspinema palackyanum]|uniref:anion permease n=1 Tax=Laspinema palackyanum TaxID=3231601 RepID=UPI00345DB4F8|nr:anion permease [Laspinema sp. D2c]